MGQESVSCFIPYIEIANFNAGDEDNATLILSLHMQGRVQSFVAVHFYLYMRQRGVFVSQFISAKAFGDA